MFNNYIAKCMKLYAHNFRQLIYNYKAVQVISEGQLLHELVDLVELPVIQNNFCHTTNTQLEVEGGVMRSHEMWAKTLVTITTLYMTEIHWLAT